jgi:phage gp36-like protein
MYITVTELGIPDQLLIKLTDDEGTGAVNTSRAETAITAAQAIIDTALSRAYSVPFSSPSEIIKRLTADIAVYRLYQRAGIHTEEQRFIYEDAMGVLDRAAKGEVVIGVDAPGPGPDFSCQVREFTREYLEGL